MPAAIQTSVLDVLKSAQEAATGNLNVNAVVSAATVSGTVSSIQSGTWAVRCQDGSGTALTSSASALDVNIKSATTNTTTTPILGTTNTAVIVVTGCAVVGFQVTGTWVGTLVSEISTDGTNYSSIMVLPVSGSAPVSSVTSNTVGSVGVWGQVSFRFRCTAYTSGTPVVILNTSTAGTSSVGIITPLPAGSANIGSVNAIQSGTWTVAQSVSTTGGLTSVSASTTSTQLLALNSSRLNAMIYNDSASSLYVALTTSATSTAFTVLVPANGFYELPPIRTFTGAIFGVWLSATGSARVTELS